MKAPLIILAGSCVGGLLAWGICGSAHGGDDQAMLGIAMFGLSALGLVVGLVWLVIAAATGSNSR